jgi:hypothetical protein
MLLMPSPTQKLATEVAPTGSVRQAAGFQKKEG